MKKSRIYLILSIIILIIFFSCYYYFFNIFETVIRINPKNLYADNQSTAVIEVIPINALGMKVPFRNVSADFEIREGKQLVEVISENKNEGVIKLKAKSNTGTVVIYVRSKYSLLPSLVEIHIYANVTINNKSDNKMID